MNQSGRYFHHDYYRTQEFRQQLDQFAAYLNLFELNSLSEQEAKSSLTVEEADIVQYRNELAPLTEQLYSIRNKYDPLIQEALADNNDKVADYYVAQRDSEQEDLMKLFKDDDYIIALIRKKKEQRIDSYYRQRETHRSEYNLLRNQFDYYFRSPSTGVVHSNINIPNDQTARYELFGDGHVYAADYTIDISNSMHYWFGAHELLTDSLAPYQGLIAVPRDSPLKENANRYKLEQGILFAYGLASTVLLVIAVIRFKGVLVARAESSRWSAYHRKLPLDAKLLFFAGTAALTLWSLANLADRYSFLFETPLIYGVKLLITLSIASLGMAATLLQWQFLVNEMHSWSDVRREWSHSSLKRGGMRIRAGFAQTMNQVKDSFIYKSAGIRLLVLALIWTGLGFIGGWKALSFLQYNDFSIVVFVPIAAIVGITAFLLSTRQLGYLNRVAQAADELASGRMPSELPRSGSGVIASLASNMNALRQGVKMLQNEQAKSERLKTELITNVSHDLRTPLTSIITYAGLLKTEDATTEERAAYVEIINQKSKRLKTMIDDLFEISTMTSGNARLLREKSDLVQLMQQALGEYKEVMDGSDVQFRVSLPEGPIYALVDGQKLWRAFDNLIGNMLKYSLSHTRAYISMQLSERQEVAITFKNVSKYEISDNAEELFERFKRGDTSRHTEGSGLGLAIAKSIIELHDGRLTLETDGDLFKASVILKVQPSGAHEAPSETIVTE
jgi:Signal transduction histidine kinase